MLSGWNFISSRRSREAARAARAAFEAYAALPPARRAAFLRTITGQLVGLGDGRLTRDAR